MRTAGIAVLLIGGLLSPIFAGSGAFRTGIVEKVLFQERLDSPPVELRGKTAPPALMGFVHLTIRDGKESYRATMYAYRPDDYPLTMRPGQVVHYRIRQEQYIECNPQGVMSMRWAMQLTLRSPKGHLWPTEMDFVSVLFPRPSAVTFHKK